MSGIYFFIFASYEPLKHGGSWTNACFVGYHFNYFKFIFIYIYYSFYFCTDMNALEKSWTDSESWINKVWWECKQWWRLLKGSFITDGCIKILTSALLNANVITFMTTLGVVHSDVQIHLRLYKRDVIIFFI